MKKLLLILLCLPMIGFGQQTYVPDDAFEDFLETHSADTISGWYHESVAIGDPTSMGNGIANDNYVTTSSIDTITYLTINNCYIAIPGIPPTFIQLVDMTGIEDFIMLSILDCSENDILELNLSHNSNLTSLDCRFNELICLNLSNGNNANMIPMPFIPTNGYNSNLTCIEVDDTTYSNNNWSTSISSQMFFSNNCNNSCSSIVSAVQEYSTNKELLKVTDLLGKETKQTNQPLFYIYDDGTVEKRIVIE